MPHAFWHTLECLLEPGRLILLFEPYLRNALNATDQDHFDPVTMSAVSTLSISKRDSMGGRDKLAFHRKLRGQIGLNLQCRSFCVVAAMSVSSQCDQPCNPVCLESNSREGLRGSSNWHHEGQACLEDSVVHGTHGEICINCRVKQRDRTKALC